MHGTPQAIASRRTSPLAVLEDKQLSKRLTDHALKMVETAFSSQRIVSQSLTAPPTKYA
jgi:hypothetical protein